MSENRKGRKIEKYIPDYVVFDLETTGVSTVYDAEKYFGKLPGNDYIDTLSVARNYLPQLSHHRLSDLASHYGISTKGAHRALSDCYMNQMVFEKLAKEMEAARSGKSDLKLCPRCGQALKVRNGKFGRFWGCSGFPGCRYTENIR